MTLTQLANFVRIAELQSLSRAAMVIGIAQPALSRQLRALEIELGAALFLRHARGVSLTPAGEVLLDRARQLLIDAERARDAVHALAEQPTGRVALGVPASLGAHLLPYLAPLLRRKYPNLRPSFVDGFSAALHARLATGDLDLAVLYEDRSIAPLPVTPLLSEDLVLASAPGVKVASASTAEMLRRHPLVLPSRPNRLRLIVDEATLPPVNPPLEVDSLPAIISMVQNGVGCTILPYSTLANEAANGSLRLWPLTDPPLTRTLVLARAQDRNASNAARAVEAEICASRMCWRQRSNGARWRLWLQPCRESKKPPLGL